MQRRQCRRAGLRRRTCSARTTKRARWRWSSCRPERYPLWKSAAARRPCRPGLCRRRSAATLVRIHAATAADPALAADFPTDAIFYDIRLEPYLVATAARIPTARRRCGRWSRPRRRNKRALVHGDVSPKNILRGPDGPVFLDAECAWWGDPAFDLAFCLNHLLLKCLWTPRATRRLPRLLRRAWRGLSAGRDWEPPAALERAGRASAAGLVPRAGGWQVAGRVHHRRSRTRTASAASPARCWPHPVARA